MEAKEVQNTSTGGSEVLPSAKNCVYTSCYCEENVWKLCQHISQHTPEEVANVYAVFISNQHEHVPLWMQKAGEEREGPVVWDYHVLLLHQSCRGCLVYDLDSTLPFPVSFNEYLKQAIRSNERLQPKYHRFFRVIPAPMFLKVFASDRSHMRKPDGEWTSPPPTYPCIVASDGTTMNLASFKSMEPGTGHGDVLSLGELWGKFREEHG